MEITKNTLKILIYIFLSIGIVFLWSVSMGLKDGVSFAIISFIITLTLFFKYLKTDVYKPLTKEDFDDLYNDNGIFEYFDDYFNVKTDNKTHSIKWDSINYILAYKIDALTFDLVCLEITYGEEQSFKINEETKGWYQFIEKSKKHLVNINKNWDIEIINPPFERNLTLIYDKKNRNLEQIISDISK